MGFRICSKVMSMSHIISALVSNKYKLKPDQQQSHYQDLHIYKEGRTYGLMARREGGREGGNGSAFDPGLKKINTGMVFKHLFKKTFQSKSWVNSRNRLYLILGPWASLLEPPDQLLTHEPSLTRQHALLTQKHTTGRTPRRLVPLCMQKLSVIMTCIQSNPGAGIVFFVLSLISSCSSP